MLYTSNNVAAQGRLDETNQSQAKNIKARHSEIAMRYAWDGRRRGKKREPYNRIANIRLRELERLFGDRWGDALPDDDAGRDELLIALHHIVPIAECPDAAMKDWASVWAPWIDPDELESMIQDVFAKPLRWTADKLGWRLGLRDADRTRLVIGTIGGIDVNKHARLARRKKRNKEAKAAKRHAAGAKPRKASLARTEPWKQLGMSRATWFRRSKPKPPVRRHNETVETVSGTPDEDICSSLQSKFDLALHATSARANAALRPLQSKELPERRAKARARLS